MQQRKCTIALRSTAFSNEVVQDDGILADETESAGDRMHLLKPLLMAKF